MDCLYKLLFQEEGQGLVGYAFILSLIATLVFASIELFGTGVKGFYENVLSALA